MSAPPLEIVIARDAAALAALAADRIARLLAEAATRDGSAGSSTSGTGNPRGAPVSVALAGGRTPSQAYRLLAGDRRVPWSRLEIFLGDERCVPPESPDSNARMLREALRDARDKLRPQAFHPMWAPEYSPDAAPTAEALERAARAYETQLPAQLDLLLLGLGADGHIASLFPGSPALGERVRRVLPARAPVAPHERLTLTPPAIAAARQVLVLVSGEEKSQAVARALADPAPPRNGAPPLPADLARRGTWLLDQAAAAKLGAR